jgi:hypothetical protein
MWQKELSVKIFPYLYFSNLLIWYWGDIFAQENLEFNSFAISLRFGYFFHRLTGLKADSAYIVGTGLVCVVENRHYLYSGD